MSRIWLARHGETEWSRSGRHTGTTDVPLTPQGEAAATALGARLAGRRFAAVFASPLLRARRTCSLAGYGAAMTIEPDLIEWNYGDDEGRTTLKIREERPGWTVWRDGATGGETAADVGLRADRVIERVRGVDGDILLFAHGHVLRVLGARWLGLPPEDGRRLALSTAALSILGYERETPVLHRWNDDGSLPD